MPRGNRASRRRRAVQPGRSSFTVVGDVGQPEDADLQGIRCRIRARGGFAPQSDAVLFGEGQVRHKGQDSQDGAPGAFGDEVDPLPEELGVAPELVDDETGQEAALGGGE